MGLNVSAAIVQYTLDHEIFILLVLEPHVVESLVFNEHLVHGVEATDGHFVGGESTGLVSDDLVGTAHGLGGLNISDQTVALLHLGDGVGKGNGDG
jgi:hypothetical protein